MFSYSDPNSSPWQILLNRCCCQYVYRGQIAYMNCKQLLQLSRTVVVSCTANCCFYHLPVLLMQVWQPAAVIWWMLPIVEPNCYSPPGLFNRLVSNLVQGRLYWNISRLQLKECGCQSVCTCHWDRLPIANLPYQTIAKVCPAFVHLPLGVCHSYYFALWWVAVGILSHFGRIFNVFGKW